MYAPVTGMSAAIPTQAGYYSSGAGNSTIKAATIGNYVPSDGQTGDTPAPTGYYAPVKGMQSVILAGDLDGDGLVTRAELNSALTNYYQFNPWLMMTNTAGLGGTNVTFALSNSVEANYSVQWSTNLTAWNYLGPASPRYQFTDTNAPALPLRYYRLRWP